MRKIIESSYRQLNENFEQVVVQVMGCNISPDYLLNPTGNYDINCIMPLLNTLCVGYNLDDQEKTALYTHNFEIIEALNQAGYLVDTNMSAVRSALESGSISKKIKTKGYYGVRLDFVALSNGKPTYTVKVRHSLVDANKFLVVPLMRYFIFYDIFSKLASKCPVEIVTSWQGVETKKVITTSPDILRRAFAKAPASVVESKVKYGYCGVNPRNFHICGYSVQSSLDSVAPATFSLRAFKDINFVKKIDTTGNNVSDAYVYLYYRGCIMKQLKMGSNASFQFMNMKKQYNIEDGANINETAHNWFSFAKRMPANQLYLFMKKYPQVFGNVADGITAVQNRQKAVTDSALELPVNVSDVTVDQKFVEGVKRMLSNGAVRILYQSKGGDYSTMILTNNMRVLESYYGENYVGEFETVGVRLALAKKMLQENHPIHEAEEKCRFLGTCNLVYGEVTPSDCIAEIENYLAKNQRAKPKNEFLVSCRSLTASNSGDFWKSIDVRKIIECKYFM